MFSAKHNSVVFAAFPRPWDIWLFLETLLAVPTERVFPALSKERPRMVLDAVPGAEQAPLKR